MKHLAILVELPGSAGQIDLFLVFLGFSDELPGVDEFPPGDASQLGSILCGFGCFGLS